MTVMGRSMDIRKAGKICFRHISFLLGGAALGLAALLLVFLLPVDNMQLHVWQSMPMLEPEFESEQLLEGYPASIVGNFTDCLMLENAIYRNEEHTLLDQVLYMYRGESGTEEKWAPGYSLSDYLSGIPQPTEVEYSRYWHGYLVILKPLLHFMTFNAIRVLASAVQMILAGIVVLLCGKRGETVLGMGFLVSLPFLYFFALPYSLSLSICYYIFTVSLCIQLKMQEQLVKRGWYPMFFLLCGMASAYFDLLTYPLVTLGFPLCVCLYLDKGTWKEGLKKLVGYSAEWGIGYLGLWALKWGLTDLMAGGRTVADALDTILTRTGSASGQSKAAGFFTVVKQNLSAFASWSFYLLLAAILLCAAVYLLRNRKRLWVGGFGGSGALFAAALLPFAWWFLTQNHSQQHWLFTCKIFAVSIFALVCAVGRAARKT